MMVTITSILFAFIGITVTSASAHEATPVHQSGAVTRSLNYNSEEVLVKRGSFVDPYTTTDFIRYTSELSSAINVVKNAAQNTIRKNKNKIPSIVTIKSLQENLLSAKLSLQVYNHKIKGIPKHHHHPSGHPHNSPTVPGCAGKLAEIIVLLQELVKGIKDLASKSTLFGILLKAHIADIDSELAALIRTSETVLPNTQAYTRAYTKGLTVELGAINFLFTLSALA